MVTEAVWWPGSEVANASRLEVIALNLGVLGLGCSAVVHIYNSRFRQLDRATFPLESWQSQVRNILALAVIPVCALVMAIVIPPTARAFQLVFLASIIGAFVCLAVTLSMGASDGR